MRRCGGRGRAVRSSPAADRCSSATFTLDVATAWLLTPGCSFARSSTSVRPATKPAESYLITTSGERRQLPAIFNSLQME